MRRTAQGADCSVAGAVLISAQPLTFADCAAGASVLIELEGEGGGARLLALLDWVQHQAEAGARRAVVSAPAALIDLVRDESDVMLAAGLLGSSLVPDI